jgi:hypothetical protein
MAYLSLYDAHKFRAAVYLEQNKKDKALDAIGTAYGYWKNYTTMMDELFIGVDMQRNYDFTDWHNHDKNALQDYLDLGGKSDKVNNLLLKHSDLLDFKYAKPKAGLK